MFEIVVLLLLALNAGVYCGGSEVGLQRSGQPVVPGTTITVDQIDGLADVIIRIHGVELGNNSEDNLNNIENLKLLVANVSRNLEEKLEEKRRKELNAKKTL